jgi:hypothetical protein
VARPEETFESITFAARDNVHVEMRNALADAIVGADEGSLGVHGLLDSSGEHLHIGKNRVEERFGQVGEGFEMSLRNEKTVTGKEWAMIQKREGVFVLEDTSTFDFAEENSAEGARLVEFGRRGHVPDQP